MTKPSCFGHYLHDECNGRHHECKIYGYYAETEENSCRLHTNQAFGMCDCEYKRYCHEGRQLLRAKYTKNDKLQCSVYHDFLSSFPAPVTQLDISEIDTSHNPIAESYETILHIPKETAKQKIINYIALICMWFMRRLFIFKVDRKLFWKWLWSKPTKVNGKICGAAGNCVNYCGCGPGHRCDNPCRYCLIWTWYPNEKQRNVKSDGVTINF